MNGAPGPYYIGAGETSEIVPHQDGAAVSTRRLMEASAAPHNLRSPLLLCRGRARGTPGPWATRVRFSPTMDRDISADTDLVAQRLWAIVEALDAQNVGADAEELWFEPAGAHGLQIRLGGNPDASCYDRSSTFTISYGGQPSTAGVPPNFLDALERIKAIDASPIAGVAAVFSAAAQAVARRFATRIELGGPRGPHGGFPQESGKEIRSVVVVGGGTAGYFAALALKSEFPDVEITLIESHKIPIIGVGEATTTLMPPFLHWQLGIDIVELYRHVRPTWKLGIKFEWGLPGDYTFIYPFGDGNPVEAYAHDGHIANQSVCALMMAADRSPIVIGDDGEPLSLLEHMPFAYHLENASFVAYLHERAQRTCVHHVDAEIKEVVRTADGERVDGLILDDGRVLRGDLYVDASGFRSLLIGQTLGSPFISYASSLLCDSAVVGTVRQNGTIQPYTTARTMDAGWRWRIPVVGEDHYGYVHSSAHLTVDEATAEMRAKTPGLGDTWTVRFRSGRREEFWKGNTVAVGNAYGFVEPLESTALHMVIMEVRCLLRVLHAAGNGQWDRTLANKSVGAHWDYLRWFLAVHYKYNRKADTEFWRTCREAVDVSGIEPLLERFRSVGPVGEADSSPYVIPDPVFNYHGVLTMLLGQQVPGALPTKTWLSKSQWETRVAESRALVARALTQAEALDLLQRRPEFLQNLTAPNSGAWIIPRSRDAEFVKVPDFWAGRAAPGVPSSKTEMPGGAPSTSSPNEHAIPYGHLLRSIAPILPVPSNDAGPSGEE